MGGRLANVLVRNLNGEFDEDLHGASPEFKKSNASEDEEVTVHAIGDRRLKVMGWVARQTDKLSDSHPTHRHRWWKVTQLFSECLIHELGEFAFLCELGGVGHREMRVQALA